MVRFAAFLLLIHWIRLLLLEEFLVVNALLFAVIELDIDFEAGEIAPSSF